MVFCRNFLPTHVAQLIMDEKEKKKNNHVKMKIN